MANCTPEDYFAKQSQGMITPKMLDKLAQRFRLSHSVNKVGEAPELVLDNFARNELMPDHPDVIDFLVDVYITGIEETKKLKKKVEVRLKEETKKESPKLDELNQIITEINTTKREFHTKLDFLLELAMTGKP